MGLSSEHLLLALLQLLHPLKLLILRSLSIRVSHLQIEELSFLYMVQVNRRHGPART